MAITQSAARRFLANLLLLLLSPSPLHTKRGIFYPPYRPLTTAALFLPQERDKQQRCRAETMIFFLPRYCALCVACFGAQV